MLCVRSIRFGCRSLPGVPKILKTQSTMKAVYANRQTEEDPVTSSEWLDVIEAKGREVADA